MKKFYLSIAALALCFTSCKKETATDTTKTEVTTDTIVTKEATPEKPKDTAAENEAWRKYMAPNEAHKMMAEENGKWVNEMTFWTSPDAAPEKHMTTSVGRMILGGRFQEMDYQGDMMGMHFEGRSTLAYNTINNEYTSTWIDNMGTGMMVAKGVYDEATKSITFKGEMINPVDGKKKPSREVYTFVNADTRKMESYDIKNGKEYKSMEILMKRKK